MLFRSAIRPVQSLVNLVELTVTKGDRRGRTPKHVGTIDWGQQSGDGDVESTPSDGSEGESESESGRQRAREGEGECAYCALRRERARQRHAKRASLSVGDLSAGAVTTHPDSVSESTTSTDIDASADVSSGADRVVTPVPASSEETPRAAGSHVRSHASSSSSVSHGHAEKIAATVSQRQSISDLLITAQYCDILAPMGSDTSCRQRLYPLPSCWPQWPPAPPVASPASTSGGTKIGSGRPTVSKYNTLYSRSRDLFPMESAGNSDAAAGTFTAELSTHLDCSHGPHVLSQVIDSQYQTDDPNRVSLRMPHHCHGALTTTGLIVLGSAPVTDDDARALVTTPLSVLNLETLVETMVPFNCSHHVKHVESTIDPSHSYVVHANVTKADSESDRESTNDESAFVSPLTSDLSDPSSDERSLTSIKVMKHQSGR